MFRRDFHDDVDAPPRRTLDPTGLLRAPAALGRGIGHGSAFLWAGRRGRLAGGGRRSPWTALAGLPALLAAAGLAAFLVAARQQRDDLRGAYAAARFSLAQALAHFALGVNALAAGDRVDALFHFERAHALDPSLAAAANNLAFLYFKADPPQPERALGLADAAVAAAPANAHCHETRGQILAALDRPADALAALERAMALGMKDDPKVRAAVADLYDELDQPALARRFREPAPDETPDATNAGGANAGA